MSRRLQAGARHEAQFHLVASLFLGLRSLRLRSFFWALREARNSIRLDGILREDRLNLSATSLSLQPALTCPQRLCLAQAFWLARNAGRAAEVIARGCCSRATSHIATSRRPAKINNRYWNDLGLLDFDAFSLEIKHAVRRHRSSHPLLAIVSDERTELIGPAARRCGGGDSTTFSRSELPSHISRTATVKWFENSSRGPSNSSILFLSVPLLHQLRRTSALPAGDCLIRVNSASDTTRTEDRVSAMHEVDMLRSTFGLSLGTLAAIDLIIAGAQDLQVTGFDLYTGLDPYRRERILLDRYLHRSNNHRTAPIDRRLRQLWDFGVLKERDCWRLLATEWGVSLDSRLCKIIELSDRELLISVGHAALEEATDQI